MKRLFIIMALLMFVNISYGQKRKVTTAQSLFTQGKLDKAKEEIDGTINHPDVVNFDRGHMVRGYIYQAIGESEDPAVKALAPKAFDVAWEEYKRAMELDSKQKLDKEIAPQLLNLGYGFINQGIVAFNASNFEEALRNFKMPSEINASRYGSHKIDTMSIYYAGLAAEKAELYDEAIKYLKEALSYDYNPANAYAMIANILLRQGREAEAEGNDDILKSKQEEAVKYLLEGNERFPDDQYMLVELINYYLLGGEPEEAEQYLDKAIELNPTKADLYRTKGNLYQSIGKTPDAEAMYRKTIELDDNDFVAWYQLGNIELDRTNEDYVKVNQIEDIKKFDIAHDEVMKKFQDNVLPYFEKALSIEPENINALKTLSRLYFLLRTREGTDFQKKYDAIQIRLGDNTDD